MDNKQVSQNRLFALVEAHENLKAQLKTSSEELEQVLADLGVNTYHQDPATGLVYKVYVPDGTFVYFKKIDYKRTAKQGEKGGTVLSKTEAQEAGFVLSK